MKWAYTIPKKVSTSLLLLGVLLLVLVNNLSERSNSKQLKTAFESIYEDRLMAESYILRLSEELRQIEELLNDPVIQQKELLEEKISEIEHINLLFLNTKLTETEELHFEHFENLTWELAENLRVGKTTGAESKIEDALVDLHLLSKIQVSEAQTILADADRIFYARSISSQFEIGLLVVIGLIIQGLLFASKSLLDRRIHSAPNLN